MAADDDATTASAAAAGVSDNEAAAAAAAAAASSSSSSSSVEAMVSELQRLTQALRREHGVSCTILGKDGRVVALKGEEKGSVEKEGSVEEEEASGSGGGGLACLGSLVGHEQTDVVLKINGAAIQYLPASSAALSAHSPYFQALFSHAFAETQTRIVELHLPCVAVLEPTLFHLHTGQAPEPLPHGGKESLSPDHFFGLLANAKYLLLERLTEQCADFLARLVETGTEAGFVGHPRFGPELVPAASLLRIFDRLNPRARSGLLGPAMASLREHLLAAAFAWLDGVPDDDLGGVLATQELTAVAATVERTAQALGSLQTLRALHDKCPRGFRRLVSLAPFLPQLVKTETALSTAKGELLRAKEQLTRQATELRQANEARIKAKRELDEVESARSRLAAKKQKLEQLLSVQQCSRCKQIVPYSAKDTSACTNPYPIGMIYDNRKVCHSFTGAWTDLNKFFQNA